MYFFAIEKFSSYFKNPFNVVDNKNKNLGTPFFEKSPQDTKNLIFTLVFKQSIHKLPSFWPFHNCFSWWTGWQNHVFSTCSHYPVQKNQLLSKATLHIFRIFPLEMTTFLLLKTEISQPFFLRKTSNFFLLNLRL